jgi:bidirectional [NiFe] hydrogenase diaphorase subunit
MDLAELSEIADKERCTRKELRIRCCTAAGCISANSLAVKQSLEDAVTRTEARDHVEVCSVGCMRLCCQGPLVQVGANGLLYEKVTPEDAPSIVASLNGGAATAQRGDPNQPFFTRQISVVLENSGLIDPERIEDAIAAGGYQSLHQVLREMSPAQVVDAITAAGYGGAAAPGIQRA